MSDTMSGTMRAAVVEKPGPPEVLQVRDAPRPVPRAGWALIRVRAFGVNRSEMFTRQGHSPGVEFPRILGIECVGELVDPGGSGMRTGATVAAMMGGLGRAYDGGYAQFTLVPTERLMPLRAALDWPLLAALPETFLTAHGSLEAMGLRPGQRLLIRNATSSVGMAALSLAAASGLEVAATTRSEAKAATLRDRGATHVIVDHGDLPAAVRGFWSGGADGTLDLVGGPAVLETLHTVVRGGIVCVTGIAGGWIVPEFEPLGNIPTGVRLTAFHSDDVVPAEGAHVLERIADDIAAGRYGANIDRVFALDDIVEAHEYMEQSRATGKLVVLTD
jgi:NADPH:quinone reductase-like Zn-dependent oxidoreductase